MFYISAHKVKESTNTRDKSLKLYIVCEIIIFNSFMQTKWRAGLYLSAGRIWSAGHSLPITGVDEAKNVRSMLSINNELITKRSC